MKLYELSKGDWFKITDEELRVPPAHDDVDLGLDTLMECIVTAKIKTDSYVTLRLGQKWRRYESKATHNTLAQRGCVSLGRLTI